MPCPTHTSVRCKDTKFSEEIKSQMQLNLTNTLHYAVENTMISGLIYMNLEIIKHSFRYLYAVSAV